MQKILIYLIVPYMLLFVLACANDDKKERLSDTGKAIEAEAPEKPQESVLERDTVEVSLKAMGDNMNEMHFDKKEIKVPKNTVVKLHFSNEAKSDKMKHNFVLVQQGAMEAVAKEAVKAGAEKTYVPQSPNLVVASPMVEPLNTKEFTFLAPEPGNYEFFCSYPGRWQKMHGTFIVEE